MTLKKQRKIRYIPLLHLCILFFWINMYFTHRTRMTSFFGVLLKTFVIFIIIVIPLSIVVILLKAPDIVVIAVSYLLVYFSFDIITGNLIKDQERIYSSEEK